MLGVLCSFLCSLTWAVGVPVYSDLCKRYSPFVVNLSRATVAFPLFIFFGFVFEPTNFSKIESANILWLVLSILSSYALGDVLFLWSTRWLGIPAALAIASAYPMWSAISGVLFLGESLTLSRCLALLTVIVGVVTVILSGIQPGAKREKRSNYWAGIGLAGLTSFFWALNTFANNRGGHGLSVYSANGIRMGSALILCFSFAVAARGTKRESPLFLSWTDWKKSFLVLVFEGFGGSFFFVYGLTHAPLAVASALSSLAPALSVPLAVISGREKMTPLKAMGVLVVVAGVGWLVVG